MNSSALLTTPAFVLLLIAFIGGQSDAIKCYQCTDVGCGDPFNTTNAKSNDCGSINRCLKSIVKSVAAVAVTRSCALSGSTSAGCATDGDVTGCQCSTDLCNGATTAAVFTVSHSLAGLASLTVAAAAVVVAEMFVRL